MENESPRLLPRPVRHAVVATLGLALAVAAYLMIVRGPAMLLDLASSAARVFCF